MKITIIENTIVILDVGNLKKYQISQLEYFGYKREYNSLLKNCDNIGKEAKGVTDYFKEEDISYELSEFILPVIEEYNEKKKYVSDLFLTAKNIKQQGILGEPFTDFSHFVKRLPRKLKPHQLKSAYHFYVLKNGANFSVPGSGKTSTILAVYEKLRLEGKCNLLFIVGPPSCFQPWKNEFRETLGRTPDSIVLSGGNKSYRRSEYYRSHNSSHELYLSTFHTVLNDCADIIKFVSQSGIKVFLIVDEAHYIKQLGGSWASSLLKIGKHVSYRGVLTGTPIPKSYKDLFNLFDFLWEENSPLSEEDKIQIEIWEKKKKRAEVKELIDNRIGSLFYRVRKKDLGLIPAIFHEPIYVKMNENENLIYHYVKSKIFDLNQSDYFKNEDILNKLWRGRMMRLRQSVSYPGLLLSAIDDYPENFITDSSLQQRIRNYYENEIPGKLIVLTEIVLRLRKENKKVLIWSNFIGTLELIQRHLTSIGERAELIYGKTPVRKDDLQIIGEEKTREDIRDEFLDVNSGLDILIANPAACAESISLHKTCFHAVYYDLSYNCAQYLQSLDRIHRVGGSETNEANYYFLQYENSVDQDIKQNVEAKAQRMYDVMEQDYNIYNLNLFDENNEEEQDDDIAAYKRLFLE